MRKIVLVLIIFLMAKISFATVFYIDPVNGHNFGNGSLSDPWKTLEHVINNNKIESFSYITPFDPNNPQLIIKNQDAPIKTGDTIMLYSGLHGNISIVNYINDLEILVKAVVNETPILKTLHLQGAKEWKFEGISISSEPYGDYINNKLVFLESHAWQGPVSNIEINNCEIYSTTTAWSDTTNWINKASDGIIIKGDLIKIENNNLQNIRFGISMRGDFIDVKNNTISNFSGDGIRLLGSNNVIESNLIKNCYAVDNNHDDGIQAFTTGGLIVNNNIINKNIILNNEDANQSLLGDLQGIGCFDGPFYNWTVENNLISVNHWHGISLYGAINCNIINNTVIDPTPNIGSGPAWIKIADMTNYPSTNCVVKNNTANSFQLTNSTISGNNSVLATTSDYANNFVDYVNNDFHLISTSVLIDQADNSVAPIEDLEGNPRPSGASSDIGAYEYIYTLNINENQIGNNLLAVFPNPFIEEITLSGTLNDVNIKIYDIHGKLILNETKQKLPVKFNLKSLIPGIYFVAVFFNNEKTLASYKIIKE